jgi:hypothetical protein
VSRSSGASALTSPEGPRELAVRGEERATSLNAVLMKIPVIFCAEIERSILKYIWKYKIPRIAKAILSELTNARGITIQNFKLYYRAITIKIIWYSLKNINSYIYSQLIFDNVSKNTMKKTDAAGKTRYPCAED